MILTAACYFKADYYSPTLRATVPGAWHIEMDAPIPGYGNIAPVYVGETRADAIRNAAASLRDRGLSGSLRLHA